MAENKLIKSVRLMRDLSQRSLDECVVGFTREKTALLNMNRTLETQRSNVLEGGRVIDNDNIIYLAGYLKGAAAHIQELETKIKAQTLIVEREEKVVMQKFDEVKRLDVLLGKLEEREREEADAKEAAGLEEISQQIWLRENSESFN